MVMADRITAEKQLARILQLIPHAVRSKGASLSDLAAIVGGSEQEVVRDLEEVYTRAFYQPAGSADDVQIAIEADRVSVWTPGAFVRPVRLSPQESIAAALALRVVATESPDASEAMSSLADRLNASLLDRSADEARHYGVPSEAISAGAPHDAIASGARERRSCCIDYLKPGAAEPERRHIDPYALVHAGGRWYVIAQCHRNGAIRVFRLDRMLRAEVDGATFEIPGDFKPTDYIAEGRVFRGQDLETATVRYSAKIARAITEAGPVTPLDDGSVIVRYAVADRGWLVRHILEHGVDAVVLDPPEIRALVVEAAGAIGGFPSPEG